MRAKVFPDAEGLLRAAGDGLERREVENSLVLGLLLAARGAPPGPSAFHAAVTDGAELVLAAAMTPPRPLLLAGEAVAGDDALAPLVAELRASGRAVPWVVAPAPLAERFARLWTSASGVPGRLAMSERLHALTRVEPVPAPRGRMRRARATDLGRVAGWMAAFEAEALGAVQDSPDAARTREAAGTRIAAGELYVWDDGEPRALAGRARPTRRTVAVNAVYTPPESRGRGLATALVAELSRALLREGFGTCVLFTDLANPTSNAIYARIGYRPVRDYARYRFGEEG